jgi:hypothetical protein
MFVSNFGLEIIKELQGLIIIVPNQMLCTDGSE